MARSLGNRVSSPSRRGPLLRRGARRAVPAAIRGKLARNVDDNTHKHRFYAKYKRGTKEPLHIHAKASVEWVVLSGKFDVETGPVFHVPGHERTRETLVAGSFMVIPKGQPHKVHCLEPGVVFVSYEGNPDITPIAEHDA